MSNIPPTPWRIDGATIRAADGCVVVSALNPCGMATRRRIVAAVNAHAALKAEAAAAAAVRAAMEEHEEERRAERAARRAMDD